MSNTLTKLALVPIQPPVTHAPGPGEPGYPGSPGTPAWTEHRTEQTWGITRIIYVPANPLTGDPPTTRYMYGPITVTTTIYHPAVPPSPAIPPPFVVLPPVEINYQFGWDAGAIGVASIPASGLLQFKINPVNVGIFMGFGPVASNSGYKTIRYALRFDGGQFYVYFLGTAVTGSPFNFVATDEFTMRRQGRQVAVYKNTTLIHTYVEPSDGALYISASEYAAGDQIKDASITLIAPEDLDDHPEFTEPETGGVTLTEPRPRILLYGGAGIMRLVEPEPRILLRDRLHEGAMDLIEPAPVIRLMGPDFAGIQLVEPEPIIRLEGGLIIPDYGYIQLLEPEPYWWSDNRAIGRMDLKEPLPRILLYEGKGVMRLVEPEPIIFLIDENSFNTIKADIPDITVAMLIEVLPTYFAFNVIRADIPDIDVKMYGAHRIIADVPPITVEADFRIATGIDIEANIPYLDVKMESLTGTVATIVANVPGITVESWGGGSITAEIPDITVDATIDIGTAMWIKADVPDVDVAMENLSGTRIAIAADIPSIEFDGHSQGYLAVAAFIPEVTAYVSVSIAGGVTAPVLGPAYTMTLNNPHRPVTRYTNFAFRSIIRFGDQHIAFGAAGAFELAGKTDNGVKIPWQFKFGETNKCAGVRGSETFNKRTHSVYWDGAFANKVTMTVAVDGGRERRYDAMPPDATLRTLRIDPGKGLLGQYWQFGLFGTGAAELHRGEILNKLQPLKIRYS